MVSSAKSCTTLSEHNSCKTHLMSMQKQAEFLVRAEGGHTTVAQRLVCHNEQLIAANRAKMISLLNCIIFCGRHGIALRGHRNEDFDPTSGLDPVENSEFFLLYFGSAQMQAIQRCSVSSQHRTESHSGHQECKTMLQCLTKYMQGVN